MRYLIEQPEPERLEEEGGDAVEQVDDGEDADERRVEPDGLYRVGCLLYLIQIGPIVFDTGSHTVISIRLGYKQFCGVINSLCDKKTDVWRSVPGTSSR